MEDIRDLMPLDFIKRDDVVARLHVIERAQKVELARNAGEHDGGNSHRITCLRDRERSNADTPGTKSDDMSQVHVFS
ncbi:hypothetical protein [Hoeflea sp. BAL378]|uniref:hypothetical protein n=1 Tax=Hoeflea sp. BAL378 TaxID=1547437 RepID=UPI000B0EE8C1|nr:hypothetical protein [Hoeflea sp. BAL378]